jgi:sensor histidine kinase YesM
MKSFQKFLLLGFLPILIITIIVAFRGTLSDLSNMRINYLVATFFLNISFCSVYVFEKVKGSFYKKGTAAIICLTILATISELYFDYFYFKNAKINFDIQDHLLRLALSISILLFFIFILEVNKKTIKRIDLTFEENNVFYLKLVSGLTLLLTFFLIFFFIFDYSNLYSISEAFGILFFKMFGFSFSVTVISHFSIYFLNKVKFLKGNFFLIIILTSLISLPSIAFLGFPNRMNFYSGFIGSFYAIQLFVPAFIIFILFFRLDKKNKNKQILNLQKLNSKREAEYTELKNQVNPHFLFNNMNVLISLIEIDPEKAIAFGHNLSNVYRHYLKNQTEDFVPLKEEMDFINEYLEIYKSKFDAGFKFHLNFRIDADCYILSSCLQEIIDNFFKHNILDRNIPLSINFDLDNDYLVISNSKNLKQDVKSTYIGLENINNRYKMLINKEIEIVNNADLFVVKLPIVKIQN